MKKLLFISMVLILILTALMPAAALGRSDRHSAPQKAPPHGGFTGTGLIYVTYMPAPEIKGKTWRYYGEIAEGFLQQCDWEPLAGTAFWSTHDSVVQVQSDGTARGIMRGEFMLVRPDGSGALEGFFEGKISGNLFTGFISDEGVWSSRGGTGVFEGVKANGKWSADLYYDPGLGTLVGPLNWDGRFLER